MFTEKQRRKPRKKSHKPLRADAKLWTAVFVKEKLLKE